MLSEFYKNEEPISSLVYYLPRTGKILDAGCGPCLYAERLKKINENIICLDIVNSKKNNDDNLPFCFGSITHLPIRNNSIDFIYCLTVLQYIDDDANTIKEFHRILKPKGKLLITIPTKWSPFWLIREMEIYFDLYPMESLWNIRPYTYYTRKMIGNLIENQFDIIELKGFLYNFFPRFFLLFLTSAKKNRYFKNFLSRLTVFIKFYLKPSAAQNNSDPTFIASINKTIRKRKISKISDISYHYLIVLEKR